MSPDRLAAVVTERTFLGEKIEYALEINGHILNATVFDPLHRDIFNPGQKVGVGFVEDGLHVLK